ncbi:MAG: hypothetical protein EXQ47_11425 [Bryobacterales bacterium]|nr:hypothetical protein [Bryobacterales bacterium]
MPWSGDMRCLDCDGKLPLYRKLTSGQFCSAGHSKAYWEEQERLAVERLHQTHDSLMAYRASAPLEPVLNSAPASEPFPSESLPFPEQEPPRQRGNVEYGAATSEFARKASNRGNVKMGAILTEARPAPHAGLLIAETEIDFAPWSGDSPWIPSCEAGGLTWALEIASSVVMARSAPIPTSSMIRVLAGKDEPLLFAPAFPRIPFVATLQSPEFDQPLPAYAVEAAEPEQPEYPFSDFLFALPRIAARAASFTPGCAAIAEWPAQSIGLQNLQSAHLMAGAPPLATRQIPLRISQQPRTRNLLLRSGVPQAVEFKAVEFKAVEFKIDAEILRVMSASALASAVRFGLECGIADSRVNGKALNVNSPNPIDVRADVTGSPYIGLRAQGLEPALSLAPGCRYQIAIAKDETAAGVHSPGPNPLEMNGKSELMPLPVGFGAADRALPACGKLPLNFALTPGGIPAAQPMVAGVTYQYPEPAPLHPAMGLQPVEGELVPAGRPRRLAGWARAFTGSGEGTNLLTNTVDFWKHAPRDLKMLVVAIPILLGLALRPSLPKVRVSAPAMNTQIPASVGHGFQTQWMNVRRTVASRAGVALNEEFRSGLDDWQSKGGVATAWSFDSTGFVRPGSLALYRPSMGLTNYELQFLGLIDQRAMSWVVRAADFDNYYVVKLVVVKPGPMPTMGITRYAVINGKAQDRVDTVARINARTDTLYQVSMNVNDDTFLLTLQGIVVDYWTDARLKNGGVGFFSTRGEDSRVRWVQVTHQYDMLGRLCAYLAPYNISTTNGSW